MKKIYFEWMRIIACGLVIFNHLAGYTLYMHSTGVKQAFYMTLTMITRINVPLFFMISGALLLRKEEDFKYIIQKRTSRILEVTFLFEVGLFVLFGLKAIHHGEVYDWSIMSFLRGFFSGGISGAGAYWYLYAYLGFLLMLPFLQRIAAKMKKEDFVILFLIHFAFSSFLPLLNITLRKMGVDGISISGDFSVPLATTKAFVYPMMGYYLENFVNLRTISKKKIATLTVAMIIGIYLSCWCTYYEGNTTGTYTQNYVQLFDYLTTIAAFILIKYLVAEKIPQLSKGNIGKTVSKIGGLTFGIYLLDPYWKSTIYGHYYNAGTNYFPVLVVSGLWVVFSMTLGGIVTVILKKLPILRKIL